MIKKISTLFFALVALLGTTNVFAQGPTGHIGVNPVHAETGMYDQGPYGLYGARNVTSLQAGANPGFFQLAIEGQPDKVLGLTPSGKLVIADLTTLNIPLGNTLWCVTVEAQDQGQQPKYNFLNKGAGMALDLNYNPTYTSLTPGALSPATDSVAVGGEIAGWSLSPQYTSAIEAGGMYSTYAPDMVIGFYVDPVTYDVHVRKSTFNAAVADKGVGNVYTEFRLQVAAQRRLDADAINSILNTQSLTAGVKLNFDPDILNAGTLQNPFNAQKFIAEDASTNHVYVTKTENNVKRYLLVDTAYTNDEGVKFLAYKWDTLRVAPNIMADNYEFMFTYDLTYDSLFIQAKKVYVKTNDNASWSTTGNLTSITYPYVSIQNIITGQIRIITVGNVQGTHISFGIPSCAASTNKTSIDQDLYLITDGDGRYLAIPHYSKDTLVRWVTLSKNMEPWHMPGFQWVVEKTQNSAEVLRPTSPLKITNREYGVVAAHSLQLYNDKTLSPITYFDRNSTTDNRVLSIDSTFFVKDPGHVKTDPYVGYKMFNQDSLLVISYVFRYLHDLNDDTYLSMSTEARADSLLGVTEESKLTFMIDSALTTSAMSNYGYTTNSIDKMVQLKRKSYRLKVKNTEKYVMADREDRYSVSTHVNASGTNPVAVFYLKENYYKTVDGVARPYYALIDTNTYRPLEVRKLAVDDNDVIVKALEISEERTSAFSIESDETPLYRRFNTTDELDAPEEGGEEPRAATVVGDETAFLKFYMTYRDEYLQVENNDQGDGFIVKGIDFLGMWTAEKAGSGLSIQVDTAWVNRGLGYIKPQYLLSIERKDFGGQEAEPCKDTYHGYADDGTPYNEWTCPHAKPAIPGYKRGKYLVNTNLLVGRNWNNKTKQQLMWRELYDRAAFVDAIQLSDTLFIPKQLDSYYTLPNDRIDIDVLRALAVANPKTGADYAGTRNTTNYIIVYLTGDNHKYATWSMRFQNPEKALAGEKEFLIESMNANAAGTLGSGVSIAPQQGQWIKLQNGVLTLSDPKTSEFANMDTSGDDALIFDVKKGSETDKPLDNANVDASAVTVIAETGAVVIKNAAGKKVAISNILGQTVANTVITSDNATIAVPQGVVVVAVEGEAAVKAIVK